jgi:hypothetical protein
MLPRSIITRSMAVTSLLVLSSLAQAQAIGYVTVGPLAATQVPTLSGYLLIVLGLLLAVIAFRTLRSNRGAQKILSILVLGGGLIISGIGVDRTLATAGPIIETAEGTDCTAGGDIRYGADEGPTNLLNGCGNSLVISDIYSEDCTLDTSTAGCQVKNVLLAGDSCSLPQCLEE